MLHKGAHTLVLQLADNAGTQVHNLLVIVRQMLVGDTFQDVILPHFIEEIKQEPRYFLVAQNLQLVGILEIHNLVTDVVGSLHEIDQRMAHIAQGLARRGETNDTQLLSNLLINVALRAKEAELPLLRRGRRGVGILHDARQRRVGHGETALTAPLKLMGQEPESIGIALEAGDVVPEGGTDQLLQVAARTLGKERLDGLLARVSEGRVAQVVGQTGCRNNLPDLREQRALQLGVLLHQQAGYVAAQRHADAGHLQRVGQTVVHKDTARQGEHLCLVLQAAEGRRENQPVVVALELRAVVVPLQVPLLLSQPLVRYQLLPVHHNGDKVTKSFLITQQPSHFFFTSRPHYRQPDTAIIRCGHYGHWSLRSLTISEKRCGF